MIPDQACAELDSVPGTGFRMTKNKSPFNFELSKLVSYAKKHVDFSYLRPIAHLIAIVPLFLRGKKKD